MYAMPSLLRMVLKRILIVLASERRFQIRHYEHPRKMGGVETELKDSAFVMCR
jgi:hypothetical protein